MSKVLEPLHMSFFAPVLSDSYGKANMGAGVSANGIGILLQVGLKPTQDLVLDLISEILLQ